MPGSQPPFDQLKIIDLSTVLAGPSVGMFFAELGAQVLKVEHPVHKDVTRSWKLPREDADTDISAYFSSVNYKKQYLQLDLTRKKDHSRLMDLVARADMVLMNYKFGDQEKLHINDTDLRKANPQLIIGKINGFGQKSDRVAYDLILQAESGIMAMNGTPESGPVKMPIALIDVLAAHHLKEGLLIELLAKNTRADYSGKTLNVSLYDAAVSSLVNQASNYLMTGHIPQRIGSLHPNIAPYGELFKTADGKTITFAIGNNRHFDRLCDFLGVPELANDKKFATVQNRVANRAELYEILYPMIRKLKAGELLKEMRQRIVPCGEVKSLDAVFKSDRALGLVREETIDGQTTKRVTSFVAK